MAKILVGKVVSTKMDKTVLVEVVWKTAHPLYKKLLKRSNKYKAALADFIVKVGDDVQITETKPVAKGKYFKITKLIGQKEEKQRSQEKAPITAHTENKKGVKK